MIHLVSNILKILKHNKHDLLDKIGELENLGLKVAIHSSKNKNLDDIDVYIVDTFGETKKFHKIGGTVFLGGSVINRGGQNPLEAARFGARILHGPNIDNFKEVYNTLSLFNISKSVTKASIMTSLIQFKKNKNKAKKIIKIGRKILKETIKDLDKIINNEFKKT